MSHNIKHSSSPPSSSPFMLGLVLATSALQLNAYPASCDSSGGLYIVHQLLRIKLSSRVLENCGSSVPVKLEVLLKHNSTPRQLRSVNLIFIMLLQNRKGDILWREISKRRLRMESNWWFLLFLTFILECYHTCVTLFLSKSRARNIGEDWMCRVQTGVSRADLWRPSLSTLWLALVCVLLLK